MSYDSGVIGLVSDTHGLLRPEVVAGLAGVEKILHLGDVGDPNILDALERVAPVHAVRGNVDYGGWANRLPRTASVDAFGHSLYLIHNIEELDIDPAAAGVKMVLYGHSHRPDAEEKNGVWFVNPGSVGPRRLDLPISYALLQSDLSVEFVTVDGS